MSLRLYRPGAVSGVSLLFKGAGGGAFQGFARVAEAVPDVSPVETVADVRLTCLPPFVRFGCERSLAVALQDSQSRPAHNDHCRKAVMQLAHSY